ncbi:MAG: hypothetical protein ACRD4R_16130 [Candidatus Acidiferrales bacterium]
MKPVFKVCTIAFALLSPMVLFAQKPTLICRPLPNSDTFIEPDEQIVGNQICKIVVSPTAQAPQAAQTDAKPENDPQPAPAVATAPAKTVRQDEPSAAESTSTVHKRPSRPRVYVSDSNSWVTSGGFAGGVSGNRNSFTGASAGSFSGGSDPQTVEVIKNFMDECPGVIVTRNRANADFAVLFDREGGKRGTNGWSGLLRKVDKMAVFSKNGDAVFSKSTRSVGSVVKDACSAIESAENNN